MPIRLKGGRHKYQILIIMGSSKPKAQTGIAAIVAHISRLMSCLFTLFEAKVRSSFFSHNASSQKRLQAYLRQNRIIRTKEEYREDVRRLKKSFEAAIQTNEDYIKLFGPNSFLIQIYIDAIKQYKEILSTIKKTKTDIATIVSRISHSVSCRITLFEAKVRNSFFFHNASSQKHLQAKADLRQNMKIRTEEERREKARKDRERARLMKEDLETAIQQCEDWIKITGSNTPIGQSFIDEKKEYEKMLSDIKDHWPELFPYCPRKK